jgi:hypothetical protein
MIEGKTDYFGPQAPCLASHRMFCDVMRTSAFCYLVVGRLLTAGWSVQCIQTPETMAQGAEKTASNKARG